MNEILSSIGMIVAFISELAFLFGIIRLIFIEDKKFSLQILLYSVIAFIIGFGTCYATFALKL